MAAGSTYRWRFFRAGGVDQVAFRHGDDVFNLDKLDPKLWVALAMPTRGVEFDTRTLDLIDTDHDGRIRTPEVLAAVKWIRDVLKDPNDLLTGGDAVKLAAVKDGPVLVGARRILHNLDKADSAVITLEDVVDTAKIFAATKFNGDGVVPTRAADDPATQKVLEDIIATHGSVADRSGQPGVDRARVEAFFAQAQAFSDWHAKAEADPAVAVLGDATGAASTAVGAVRAKVDDFFTRCRLAAFDPRAVEPLNGTASELAALATQALTAATPEVARLPLARIEAGAALPLRRGLNPAWAAPIATFVTAAVAPIVGAGTEALTEDAWAAVGARLAAYESWIAAKPVTTLEPLGLARVREVLASGAAARIQGLIDQDLALESENEQIIAVERLVRYQRDLYRLLNNFVNFSDFYARKGAVFQTGTLYLDGRSCQLCLEVADSAKHSTLASMASTFLAYCDCTRPNGERKAIVAAFTDGDSDNLIVGRNGVFFDRAGRDWDATITRLVANPISIREAFWAPYKKFVRAIEEQVSRRAAAADAASQASLTNTAEVAANPDHPPAAAVAATPKIDVGTVAAIGVAIGGIGAMVAGVLSAFFGLGPWMPIGIAALVLLISGPSMLLAFLKLRQRNLGPILDANGWAINGRARINVPFGAVLTDVAAIPSGSERMLTDPFAEKRSPWRMYAAASAVVVLAGCWYVGRLDRYLPIRVKSTTVLGANAPLNHVPPPHH